MVSEVLSMEFPDEHLFVETGGKSRELERLVLLYELLFLYRFREESRCLLSLPQSYVLDRDEEV